MKNVNEDIRKTASMKGVKQWQIAEQLGMSESGLCRKMRHELSNDEKVKIYEAIDQVERGVVSG